MWALPPARRQQLLDVIQASVKIKTLAAIDQCTSRLEQIRERLEEIRTASWIRACERRPIVGMTSTFAAEHLGFIRALKLQVVHMSTSSLA